MTVARVHQYASTPHILRLPDSCRCTVCSGTVLLHQRQPALLRAAERRLFRLRHRDCRRTAR